MHRIDEEVKHGYRPARETVSQIFFIYQEDEPVRQSLSRTNWCNAENIWNALVQQMLLEPEGMADIESFWDFCQQELGRIEQHHLDLANPKDGRKPGHGKRMRHLYTADACEGWMHPSDAQAEVLLESARNALNRVRRMTDAPAARAFDLAEMKLCLLLADKCVVDIELSDDELRALERSCNDSPESVVLV